MDRSVGRSIGSLCFALLCFAALRPPPQHTVVRTLSGPVPQSVLERSGVCCMRTQWTLHVACDVCLACDRQTVRWSAHSPGVPGRPATPGSPGVPSLPADDTLWHASDALVAHDITGAARRSCGSCGSTIPCAHLWAADGSSTCGVDCAAVNAVSQ